MACPDSSTLISSLYFPPLLTVFNIPKMFALLLSLLLFPPATLADSALLLTRTINDLCDRRDRLSCGVFGVCLSHPLGARCRCPAGWMGMGCKRPCQDVYQSCDRWGEERRCSWTRTAFFLDNCAKTCGICRQARGQQNPFPGLPYALPVMLEPLSWLVGRWKTQTFGQRTDRFPTQMKRGPYTEILDIQLSDVPAFDRPPLNVSVRAWTQDGWEEHNELGFITTKPAHEDTGFMENQITRTPHGLDMVALALVSNTGRMTIEEGELVGFGVLTLTTRWHLDHHSLDGSGNRINLDTVQRSFRLLDTNTLEERIDYELMGQPAGGRRKRVSKQFRREMDYLHA